MSSQLVSLVTIRSRFVAVHHLRLRGRGFAPPELLLHKALGIVGVLADDADPMVSVVQLDEAPTESCTDIGGLEQGD